ncbi:MAG TPA: MFS transporter [Xanthobacteraceae bacterium]|nr:MFS transporter [Xanthobacteraceae bacterium]
MATGATKAKLSVGWQGPLLILLCGCLISICTNGPRSSFGFFLQPMSTDLHWGRDVFAFAIAIQNIVNGIGQPFSGAIADRFGTVRSLIAGALIYSAGLVLMSYSTTPGMLTLSAGVMIGFGLSGASFPIVLAAFGKLMPAEWRSTAFGIGTAAGSFGQFLFSPLAVVLIGNVGWQSALLVYACIVLLVLPLSLLLATRGGTPGAADAVPQSFRNAIGEAFGHGSYILLVLGFFTCGFHVAFITTHLPPYLVDKGLDASWGGWVVAFIGLFNIVGSLTAGILGGRLPKRYLLSLIYFSRTVAIAWFVTTPVTPLSAMIFGGAMGLFWLSTVPLTSGLVALMFGTRYMATLFGFAFFSHQVGSFLGVWLGGFLYERTGSYDVVWWLGAALGIVAGLLNLPIRERPVPRIAAAQT